jgi:hypothetical protein
MQQVLTTTLHKVNRVSYFCDDLPRPQLCHHYQGGLDDLLLPITQDVKSCHYAMQIIFVMSGHDPADSPAFLVFLEDQLYRIFPIRGNKMKIRTIFLRYLGDKSETTLLVCRLSILKH